jgi:tRNA modification GTPase
MILDVADTIVAIASAPGGALRGIVRLSGPNSLSILDQIARLDPRDHMPAVRVPSCIGASVRLGDLLGEVPAMIYVWPTASSYTRQPSAELHLPGSPPLLEAALRVACLAGARLAEPGEFTLRAFLAGRLDLTQAEAVLGVIDAGSRQQLDSALGQLAGGLSRPLAGLRDELLDCLAELEAGLDFVEEDIEFISAAELKRKLTGAMALVSSISDQMTARGQSGRLPRIVLTGLPNVGKSSLLNALAGDKVAIVSAVAGTTRDFVSRRIDIAGRECLVIDTAGISSAAPSQLEAAAQIAAQSQAEQADLSLLCIDASRPLAAWEQDELKKRPDRRIIVITKCDLAAASSREAFSNAVFTSSRAGTGLGELRGAIEQSLNASPAETSIVAGTAERCRDSLRLAGQSLSRAIEAVNASIGEELIAAEVRVALEAIGSVVGAIYSDDILDRVFSRFCIGK